MSSTAIADVGNEITDLPLASTIMQRVQERLRNDILSGRIAPGTRLKIAEIAQRFGLSHMPVREALQALQGEGLIILSPNRGASVRALDAKLVRNLFGIREALEAHLCGEAAQIIAPAELAELWRLEAAYEASAVERDVPSMIRLNRAFHRQVHVAAGNDEAVRLLDLHAALIGAMRGRFGYAPSRPEAIQAEHRALVEALARRDSSAARSIQAAHVRGARDDMLAMLAREPSPVK